VKAGIFLLKKVPGHNWKKKLNRHKRRILYRNFAIAGFFMLLFSAGLGVFFYRGNRQVSPYLLSKNNSPAARNETAEMLPQIKNQGSAPLSEGNSENQFQFRKEYRQSVNPVNSLPPTAHLQKPLPNNYKNFSDTTSGTTEKLQLQSSQSQRKLLVDPAEQNMKTLASAENQNKANSQSPLPGQFESKERTVKKNNALEAAETHDATSLLDGNLEKTDEKTKDSDMLSLSDPSKQVSNGVDLAKAENTYKSPEFTTTLPGKTIVEALEKNAVFFFNIE